MAVGATAIWRVRPSGNNLNGGGYDPGIGGAATDYSQQNAAQASGSNATCATGTSTFVDATANAFTSAMVGNAIQIASGTNFTVGLYFVTAFTSASTVTLDRSPVGASNGSVGVWKLGGGWADFWTNTTATFNQIVPGNIIYILGSGVPNPASYTYDYVMSSGLLNPPAGDATNGKIVFANDPNTPGYKSAPDTTGGMPTTQLNNASGYAGGSASHWQLVGLWLVLAAGSNGTSIMNGSWSDTGMLGCVFDFFGLSPTNFWTNSGQGCFLIGCEVFSSGTKSSTQLIMGGSGDTMCINCNFHDAGKGVAGWSGGRLKLINCIIANNASNGADIESNLCTVINCTIDGNGGHGIIMDANIDSFICYNNIISNHTGAGAFGLNVNVGTAAANTRIAQFVDYNSYYNNTANYNNINAGPHDTALVTTPYVGSGTENYTLA